MNFRLRKPYNKSEEMTKAKYKSVQPANELKLQRPNVLCVFAGVNVHHSLYLTRNAQSATLILSLCVFLSLSLCVCARVCVRVCNESEVCVNEDDFQRRA